MDSRTMEIVGEQMKKVEEEVMFLFATLLPVPIVAHWIAEVPPPRLPQPPPSTG